MTDAELEHALCQPAPDFAGEALAQAMADAGMSSRVCNRILAQALAEVREGREHDLGFGPIYAVFLMSHHREREAFDQLAQIARLPREQSEDIMGSDTACEGGCAILWSLCDDDPDRLWSLADDPAVSSHWRDAALRALLIGVGQGALEREDVLHALQQRLREELEAERLADDPVGDYPTWLVTAITNLGVGDPALLDLAYDRGLVDGFFIDPGAWHERAPSSPAEVLESIGQRDGRRYPVRPLELRRWACFNPKPARSTSASRKQLRNQRKAKARAKAKAKAKRKIRKRSRARKKKNR